MNRKSIKKVSIFALILALSSISCEKYLNEVSDKSLSVMTSLEDLQALMDYQTVMNLSAANSMEISADDYMLSSEAWETMPFEEEKRMHIWAEDNIFRPGSLNDWHKLYVTVYYSNSVLEGLEKIGKDQHNLSAWNNIKGQALVFRAVSFLDAVQIWAAAYDEASAANDIGIPIRLQSDFNVPSTRSSIKDVYDQIIIDLKTAAELLPDIQISKTRPSKPAAYALLARTYLWMRDYPLAKFYAESCLNFPHVLLDYNTLTATSNFPFPRMNSEVIFERAAALGQPLAQSRAKVPLDLYRSYNSDDLRKACFFRVEENGDVVFKGHYYGGNALLTGPCLDEVYLTRAECFAREGNVTMAIRDMNSLLSHRYNKQNFIPLNDAMQQHEALSVILIERRKQLMFRGLRWMDIKRLNKEGASISLSRILKGNSYTLPANSPRFALPLPDDLQTYF